MRIRFKRAVVLILGIVVVASAVLLAFRAGTPLSGTGGGNVVGIIYIEGAIQGGNSSSGLDSVACSESVITQIESAREDPSVKAVVIRLNTPGGTAAAAQEIATEIKKLKSAGKKVVASMGDVAASGGYWIACAADKIVANPGSITGSIGVMLQTTDLQGLYDKLGISFEVFKSGSHKDMGSPARDVTPEERDIFQGMVNDIFQQFVDAVTEGRGLPRDQVEKLADGRIFTGRQAKSLGLVDEMGNIEDAVDLAAELAGISENYSIKEYGKTTPLERLLSFFTGLDGREIIANQALVKRLLELTGPAVWSGRRLLMVP